MAPTDRARGPDRGDPSLLRPETGVRVLDLVASCAAPTWLALAPRRERNSAWTAPTTLSQRRGC